VAYFGSALRIASTTVCERRPPMYPVMTPPCNLPAHRCRHLPALLWQYAGPSTLPYKRVLCRCVAEGVTVLSARRDVRGRPPVFTRLRARLGSRLWSGPTQGACVKKGATTAYVHHPRRLAHDDLPMRAMGSLRWGRHHAPAQNVAAIWRGRRGDSSKGSIAPGRSGGPPATSPLKRSHNECF
jgi:hypothetical protein